MNGKAWTLAAGVVLVVGLTVWGYLDVAPRGAVVPGHPEWHRTDFSVYTAAGAALLDGRDPYAVTNFRGWSYLYPPLFALMVAPLSSLDPMAQSAAWYVVSLLACGGIVVETLRLWRSLSPRGDEATALAPWALGGAAMAAILPALECLQRGQVGLVLLYAMLLGLRLVRRGRTRRAWFLGGVVLAWPIAVKLIPALPAGFLAWQRAALAVADRKGGKASASALGLGLGLLAGLALFFALVPAACVGWGANLGYLATWTRKVVTNPDAGNEARFHIDSTSNQSLCNAAHRLAIAARGITLTERERSKLRSARNEGEVRWIWDRALADRRKADGATHRAVVIAEGLVAALLLVLGSSPRRDDDAGQVAGFGLACLAVLLIAPIAWTHYFMAVIPALPAVPLWLHRRGLATGARIAAASPAALVWAHFLAKDWVGPVGLLGLGTAAWFAAVSGVMIRAQLAGPGRLPGPIRGPLDRRRASKALPANAPDGSSYL